MLAMAALEAMAPRKGVRPGRFFLGIFVDWLVVFHQPIWKNMLVKLEEIIFPNFQGENKKIIWNRHLVDA